MPLYSPERFGTHRPRAGTLPRHIPPPQRSSLVCLVSMLPRTESTFKYDPLLETGEGREKERERNITVLLPLVHPQMGTWPITRECALTGNQTSDPLAHRLVLNPLSHTSQGWPQLFSIYKTIPQPSLTTGTFLECKSLFCTGLLNLGLSDVSSHDSGDTIFAMNTTKVMLFFFFTASHQETG